MWAGLGAIYYIYVHKLVYRRKIQQTVCGFHGPAYKPYQDVGRVELDDPTLILGGLGQNRDEQVIFTLSLLEC